MRFAARSHVATLMQIAIAVAATACSTEPVSTQTRVATFDLPGFTSNRDFDLLFVVDRSVAMAPYGRKDAAKAVGIAWSRVGPKVALDLLVREALKSHPKS